MLKAVCEDFLLAGHQVVTMVDKDLTPDLPASIQQITVDGAADWEACLQTAADEADRILLIAPETSGCLENVCDLIADHDEKRISPDKEFIRLTADKWLTHLHLQSAGVKCPRTVRIEQTEPQVSTQGLSFPIVAKPLDGAGSESITLLSDSSAVKQFQLPNFPDSAFLFQEFVAGTAVSVSLIAGGNELKFLEPTRQIFKSVPIGIYSHAEHPLDENIRPRAIDLARQTMAALPPTRGYVGIDMVVSNSGAEYDSVIEINPRLTSSYILLRQISGFNLAAAML